MTDPASTPPLCEAAHETTEEEEACEERRLAGDGSPTGQDLPPYTGNAAVCAKCGYLLVSMEYQPPLSAHAMLRRNRRLVRGPLPERQLRTCDRCRYQWDESVGTAPEPLAPLTAEELAYALDNATPYPVDLAPELAAAMAARLAGMVTAYQRPGHPVWEPEVHDARPTPAPSEAP